MISEDVRRFAEDPAAWGTIPPESGFERILTDRYCVLLGPVPTFTNVSRLRLDPENVVETLGEVRALIGERSHREAIWWIGRSATPADLVDRLRVHGLVPDERQGYEPHAGSLALVEEPPAGPPEIAARRVESFEEFQLANRVAAIAFGTRAEEEAQWSAIAAERWEAERSGHGPRIYLAWLDGEAVGAARAVVEAGCPAVLMIGGGVVATARGRGVYRALVHARWVDAVSAGIPALCTHAGRMSRPILERLGFVPVAEQEILLDPATC